MIAEELYQAGRDAVNAGDYGKATEYFQLAADDGNAEGWRGLGMLLSHGGDPELRRLWAEVWLMLPDLTFRAWARWWSGNRRSDGEKSPGRDYLSKRV